MIGTTILISKLTRECLRDSPSTAMARGREADCREISLTIDTLGLGKVTLSVCLRWALVSFNLDAALVSFDLDAALVSFDLDAAMVPMALSKKNLAGRGLETREDKQHRGWDGQDNSCSTRGGWEPYPEPLFPQ
jgi:hypothetical protein